MISTKKNVSFYLNNVITEKQNDFILSMVSNNSLQKCE